jgi:hypothetical protein
MYTYILAWHFCGLEAGTWRPHTLAASLRIVVGSRSWRVGRSELAREISGGSEPAEINWNALGELPRYLTALLQNSITVDPG